MLVILKNYFVMRLDTKDKILSYLVEKLLLIFLGKEIRVRSVSSWSGLHHPRHSPRILINTDF